MIIQLAHLHLGRTFLMMLIYLLLEPIRSSSWLDSFLYGGIRPYTTPLGIKHALLPGTFNFSSSDPHQSPYRLELVL
jgi:hypothetical protein